MRISVLLALWFLFFGSTACNVPELGRVGSAADVIDAAPTPCLTGALDGDACADWRVLDAGEAATCGIRVDGSLYCWGGGMLDVDDTDTDAPAPTRIGVDSDWTQISVGANYLCGLRGGAVYCWSFGGPFWHAVAKVITPPARVGDAADWSDVSAGDDFACGRRGGALYCWGRGNEIYHTAEDGTIDSDLELIQIGDADDWTAVSVGAGWACGLRGAGSLHCWGVTYRPGPPFSAPIPVGGDAQWTHISVSAGFACGLRADRHAPSAAYCWGVNTRGRLGDGTTLDRPSPTRVGDATDWTAITTGAYHACGLRSGALYCWGFGGHGQLGDGTSLDRHTPTRVGSDSDWTHVTAGDIHTCGQRGGGATCWGAAHDGQLGVPDLFAPRLVPTRVIDDGASRWRQIAKGGELTCGVRDGGLHCWGFDFWRTLPDDLLFRPLPVRIDDAADWGAVSLGSSTCGLRGSTAWCWGVSSVGAMDGEFSVLDDAVPIVGAWDTLVLGYQHGCGLQAGAAYCWGFNSCGELGDGTRVTARLPVRVGVADDWQQIAPGSSHSCGLRAGALYCWGSNWAGALGDGTTTDRATPVQVGAAQDWTAIATGHAATCGVRAGELYCWGRAHDAPWNSAVGESTPVRIGDAADWRDVSLGPWHTCATRTDGALYCWGRNSSGQLGDGTTTDRDAPVRIGADTGWSSVSPGGSGTCALRDGAPYCWGDNNVGQLGVVDTRSPDTVGFVR